MRRSFAYALIAVLFFGLAITIVRQSNSISSYESVRGNYVSSEARLLDRNGELLHELRLNPKVRRLGWVELKQIPESLLKFVTFAEDHRFYEHHGVDVLAIGSAMTQKRGASTITMQLAGMLDSELKPTSGKRSIFTKVKQITRALLMETKWSKPQILEAYLNLSFYRGELQGIEAASEGIFNKRTRGLNVNESALLAAMIQQPNGKPSSVASRACRLAKGIENSIDCDGIESLSENLNSKTYSIEKRNMLASHVARMLLTKAGEEVQSTLEKSIQQFAVDSVKQQLEQLKGKNVNDAAVLVIHNATGQVLAYVGNSGSDSSFYVDGVRSVRQAGSTLKPFLYATAFDKKILTPVSIIDDSALEIPVSGGMYRPKNYDEKFHGKVSVAVALGSSMNVPAVKTLQLVGVENFVQRLQGVGLSTLRESEFYGPSLALGTADVSLWELTNAYRTLANNGKYSSITFVPNSSDVIEHEVYSSESAYLIGNILSDANNRSLAFGLGSPLSGKSWIAVKTGTSKDMRDNWCVGYSDTYTVGVWVGNFTGDPMWNVSGVTGAAPIFSSLMQHLHQNQPSVAPASPKNMQTMEPAVMAEVKLPEITYPVNETIVAWDPDISPEFQKMIFEAKNYNNNWIWKLNGKSLGSAKGPLHWSPKENGKFELALTDQNKKVLDQIQFEVRGVPKK